MLHEISDSRPNRRRREQEGSGGGGRRRDGRGDPYRRRTTRFIAAGASGAFAREDPIAHTRIPQGFINISGAAALDRAIHATRWLGVD